MFSKLNPAKAKSKDQNNKTSLKWVFRLDCLARELGFSKGTPRTFVGVKSPSVRYLGKLDLLKSLASAASPAPGSPVPRFGLKSVRSPFPRQRLSRGMTVVVVYIGPRVAVHKRRGDSRNHISLESSGRVERGLLGVGPSGAGPSGGQVPFARQILAAHS